MSRAQERFARRLFAPKVPVPERIGSAGIGVGGAARPPRPRSVSEMMGESIRDAANELRGRLGAKDLWG